MMQKLLKNLQNQSQHYDESVISYANRLREIGLEITALRKKICNDFNDPFKIYFENILNHTFINGLKTDIKVRIKNFDNINDVIENAAKIEKRLNNVNQNSKISCQSIQFLTCDLCYKKGHSANDCYKFTSTSHNQLNEYSKYNDEIFDRSNFQTPSLSYTLNHENCIRNTKVDCLCTIQTPPNENTIPILQYQTLNKNDQITNSDQLRNSNMITKNEMLDYENLKHSSTSYPIKNNDISIRNNVTESSTSNLCSRNNAFVSALNEQNIIENVSAFYYASNNTTDYKSNTKTYSNEKDFPQFNTTQNCNSNINLKSKSEKNECTLKQNNAKSCSQINSNKTSQTLEILKTVSNSLNSNSNSNNDVSQIHSTNSDSLPILHEKPISVESKIITTPDPNIKKESKSCEKHKVYSKNATNYASSLQNLNQNRTLSSNSVVIPISQISSASQLQNSEKFKYTVSNEISNTCKIITSSNTHNDKKIISTIEKIPDTTSNLQSKTIYSEFMNCEKTATETLTKSSHFNAQTPHNTTLPKFTSISTKDQNILTCQESISKSKNIFSLNDKTNLNTNKLLSLSKKQTLTFKTNPKNCNINYEQNLQKPIKKSKFFCKLKKFVTFKITNKCKNIIFNASNKSKTTKLCAQSDLNNLQTSKSIDVNSSYKNLNQNDTCIINNSLYNDNSMKLSSNNFLNFNSKIMNESSVNENKNTTLNPIELFDSLIDSSKFKSTNINYNEPNLNPITMSNIKTSKSMFMNVSAFYVRSHTSNVQLNKVDRTNEPKLKNLSLLFEFYNDSLQILLKTFKINSVLQNILKHECNSQLNSVLKLMAT